MYADDAEIYAATFSGGSGDQHCGSTNSNWDEAFYSNYVTIDHTSDTLDLKFTTTINSGGTDESWGLLGVSVYVSDLEP